MNNFAFGTLRSGDPSASTTDRTFTGQKQDGTGLLYYNARYYDNSLGTFLSPDTLVPDAARVVDYNRFLYVRGNPLKFSDPSGHRPILDEGVPNIDDESGGGGTVDPGIRPAPPVSGSGTTNIFSRLWNTFKFAKSTGGLSPRDARAINQAQQETGMYPAYRGREPSAAVLNEMGLASKPGSRESAFGFGGLRVTIPKGGSRWNVFSWRLHASDVDMNFIVKPDGLANIRQSENFVNAVQRAHGNNLTCAI